MTKVIAVAAAFLLAASGVASAQSATVAIKVDGANVRVGLWTLKADATTKTRACRPEDLQVARRKVSELAERHVRRSGSIAEARAKGGNPSRANEYLKLDFKVGCFEDGDLAVAFPVQGKVLLFSQLRKGETEWRDRE